MLRKEKNFDNFLNFKIVNLSKSSKESIAYSNRIFNEFCLRTHGKTTDQVIQEARQDDDPEEIVLEVLQDWVNSMSQKVGYSALRVYSSGINRYLKYQKIRLDLKDIEWPQKIQEERYAISLGEIEKILKIASFKRKAYYIALKDSGARPIEIVGLRKKDFTLANGKYKALIPAFLTKKKIARTVFFTSESTPYLSTLLGRCVSDDDMPYGTNRNPEVSRETEDKMFRFFCDKLAAEDPRFAARYESTGYHKINLYCFRGYFFTHVMRVVGDDTAHAMIGHGAYLQTYQRRTDEEKMELWNEIEPEVLVFDMSKKNQEIKRLRDANMINADLSEQVESLKAGQARLERMIAGGMSGELKKWFEKNPRN
ncbi:hypothetical protein K0U27_00560 [archaeon]|nr:hypothetical protein [archaeon]